MSVDAPIPSKALVEFQQKNFPDEKPFSPVVLGGMIRELFKIIDSKK